LFATLAPDRPSEPAQKARTDAHHVLSIPSAFPHPPEAGAQPAPRPIGSTPSPGTPAGALNSASDTAATTRPTPDADVEDGSEPVAERWVEHEIRAGDTLARVFKKIGLPARTLHRILHSSADARTLADIRPGESLRIRLTGEGDFAELVLERGPLSSLRIIHEGGRLKTLALRRQVETRIERKTAVIEDSLYAAALRAGVSEKLILQLADIFGWDIDFAREVRSGDQFSLIYREDYLDGKKLSDGPILAAEFINQGRVLQAVRYKTKNGDVAYYSPDGRPMHKAFLRAPVDFRRISSRFQAERYHPILGVRRPHQGVDYAAAVGTPVHAAGDGKVVFLGRKGGYGDTVVLQHSGKYSTLYAHLNGFRHGLKVGSHVKQGQVIAYVGQTGLATGPHLHYEFRVAGVHCDPLTVKLPQAPPIAARYRKEFDKTAVPLVAQLELLNRSMMAEAQ
jgi:murein DD-endopeptidase MepM/ murein hydrolase activator NlpD